MALCVHVASGAIVCTPDVVRGGPATTKWKRTSAQGGGSADGPPNASAGELCFWDNLLIGFLYVFKIIQLIYGFLFIYFISSRSTEKIIVLLSSQIAGEVL